MKKNKKIKKYQGLCFRCEHRALFLEDGYQPRCECGNVKVQVCSCYMFKPCRPIVTKAASGYKGRPRYSLPMISAREEGCGLLDGVLDVIRLSKTKACIFWRDKDEK